MTTTEVETITLGDIAMARIKSITWVGYGSSEAHFIRDEGGIREWVSLYSQVRLCKLDGNWCSAEPQFPYLSFEVFLKP